MEVMKTDGHIVSDAYLLRKVIFVLLVLTDMIVDNRCCFKIRKN